MRWLALVVGSVALALAAQLVHLPAAWLIGPMVTAILIAARGLQFAMPRHAFLLAQSLIIVTVAQTITVPTALAIVNQWAPISLVVLISIGAAAFTGWLLARYSSLDAKTAAWGSSPGGAAMMTILASQSGADARLVAFMQYLRVTLVVVTAAGVSRLLLGNAAPTPHASVTGGPFDPLAFVLSFGLAVGGSALGRFARIPAGQFLIPMLGLGVLHATGVLQVSMPRWLLDVGYLTMGWAIGLTYTRETLLQALRMLPTLALSTGVLIGLCGLAAALLAALTGTDPITAYLSTTPGGLDSIPIIGLEGGGNLALILAVQTARVFAVAASGPPVAKLISRLTAERRAAYTSPRA